MSRRPRENLCGATYHVMNRGNRKAAIFEDGRDRRRFLSILKEAREEYAVEILLGCLMSNHFHLVVQTPEGNVSAFMQQLEGRFAHYSNWRHTRVGHLFQDRFRDVMIENDLHLMTAACYVFMNPVTARISRRPEDWKWSTFAATAGLAPVPDYLSLTWVEALFPATSREESQRRFRELMNEAKPVHAYLTQDEPRLEAESFRQVVRSFIGQQYYLASMPQLYRSAFRPPLEELLPGNLKPRERGDAIHRAHITHGYRFTEIGRALALHADTVSRLHSSYRRGRSEPGSDPEPDSESDPQ